MANYKTNMMSKLEKKLELDKSTLELLLNENNDKCTDYKAQLSVIKQELEDLGKPEVTPEFLDKLSEIITKAVENIDLDDGITCDFELDYDNKVTMSGAQFDNPHEIADKIYYEVENLFAEVGCPKEEKEVQL